MTTPEPGLTHFFPRPEALANADLRTLGLPRSRAATLSAVATAALHDPELFTAHGELGEAVRRFRSWHFCDIPRQAMDGRF